MGKKIVMDFLEKMLLKEIELNQSKFTQDMVILIKPIYNPDNFCYETGIYTFYIPIKDESNKVMNYCFSLNSNLPLNKIKLVVNKVNNYLSNLA